MKLDGIRVLDLTQFLPGPHLTMTMADHGADVIKVEAPGGGDPGRDIGLQQDGETVFFRNTNRGKRSICLDLKSEEGRETLWDLIDWADVLVESFRPGVADRLGFGADVVRARNPRIVYCSISAFGQNGPYRDVPAHDLAIEALSGVVSVNLGTDDQPAMPGIPAADMAASLMGLSAILMALLRRTTTGRGDRIDLAMHDALVAWLPNVLGPVFVEKRAPVPKAERTWGGSAFYQIYRTWCSARRRSNSCAACSATWVERTLSAYANRDRGRISSRSSRFCRRPSARAPAPSGWRGSKVAMCPSHR